MVILHPRPYRPGARVEIAWKTWRDLHAPWTPGYDVLPVLYEPWWRRYLHVTSQSVFIHLGFGALVVWFPK